MVLKKQEVKLGGDDRRDAAVRDNDKSQEEVK